MTDKRFIFLVLFSLFIVVSAFAQNGSTFGLFNRSAIDSSYFFISDISKSGYLTIVDQNDIFEFVREKKILKLYRNGILLDTLKETGFTIDIGYARNVQKAKNKFLFIAQGESPILNAHYSIYEYSLNDRVLVRKTADLNFVFVLDGKFFVIENGKSLSELLPNYQLSTVVTLEPLLLPESRVVQVNKFSGTDVLLIMAGIGTGDAYDNEQYFILNLTTRKVEEVTAKIKSKCTQVKEDLNSYNFIIDQDRSDYFRGTLLLFRPSCIEFKNPIRLDSELTDIGEVIQRQGAIKGHLIRNNQPIGYVVASVDDRKVSYSITEIPDSGLEKAFVKVNNNIVLQSSDIKGLNKFSLHLLKNFVLAKHNIFFADKYLQIYFNQFTFYRLQVKQRRNDVTGLLTDQDKKNLYLIDREIEN